MTREKIEQALPVWLLLVMRDGLPIITKHHDHISPCLKGLQMLQATQKPYSWFMINP